MDFGKMQNVEEVLVSDTIKEYINEVSSKVDSIRNIIVIYEDKEGSVSMATTGFESDWEAIGMLEETKNTILNGEDK